MTTQELLAKAEPDIVRDVDGFYYYWPTTTGHLSATQMRVIADELDRRNADWQRRINWEMK